MASSAELPVKEILGAMNPNIEQIWLLRIFSKEYWDLPTHDALRPIVELICYLTSV